MIGYSPEMKRFVSMDPLGYVDSMNLYETFGCDPVNKVDRTGTFKIIRNHVIIEPGDTLAGIARELTGSEANYKKIFDLSGIADPDVIYPGQKIPVLEKKKDLIELLYRLELFLPDAEELNVKADDDEIPELVFPEDISEIVRLSPLTGQFLIKVKVE